MSRDWKMIFSRHAGKFFEPKAGWLFAMFAAAGIAMAVPGTANAGVITSGSVFNNTAGEFSADFPVTRLSDQTGLSSGYTDGVTDFATYTSSGVTHATVANGVSWFSDGVPSFPFVLDFDLGGTVSILSLALWNGSAGNDAAVNAISIFTSAFADFSVATSVGSFNNVFGSDDPEPVTLFDLTDTVGQFVRLQVDSHFGNLCCVGIGEVAWEVEVASGSPVPEPATLALFGAGLAGLGFFRRRQRKVV